MVAENKCFAAKKDSYYTLIRDRDPSRKDDPSCYALSKEGFKQMRDEGKCGSPECPFYKTDRRIIRTW